MSNVLYINDVRDDGTLVYKPHDNYAECFTKYIQNVSLTQKISTGVAMQALVKVIEKKEIQSKSYASRIGVAGYVYIMVNRWQISSKMSKSLHLQA